MCAMVESFCIYHDTICTMVDTRTQEGGLALNPITPWHISFGLRLRQAREKARYSTRQVATLIEERYQLQLSHGSLARIERGEQRISVGLMAVLCDIYGVAPMEVAVGSELGDDLPWHRLIRAGLHEDVVSGIVWFEQMLDHGHSHHDPAGEAAVTRPAEDGEP